MRIERTTVIPLVAVQLMRYIKMLMCEMCRSGRVAFGLNQSELIHSQAVVISMSHYCPCPYAKAIC